MFSEELELMSFLNNNAEKIPSIPVSFLIRQPDRFAVCEELKSVLTMSCLDAIEQFCLDLGSSFYDMV